MTLIFEEIEQLENSLSKLKQDYTIAVIGELLGELPTHAIGDGLGFKGQRSYQVIPLF